MGWLRADASDHADARRALEGPECTDRTGLQACCCVLVCVCVRVYPHHCVLSGIWGLMHYNGQHVSTCYHVDVDVRMD